MIKASATSGAPRQLPPPGTHCARCYQVIDLGTRTKEWLGRPPRKAHEIRVSWELPLEKAVFSQDKGEEPFAVHKSYTLSLSDKANLRHDLESWRGRAFSEQELDGFDVSTVLGVPCMITVTHVKKGESTYANVTAVTGIPKGFTVPLAVNRPVEFSLESHDEEVFRALPEFLQKIIMESDEWKNPGAPEPEDEIPMHHEPSDTSMDPNEQEIPF